MLGTQHTSRGINSVEETADKHIDKEDHIIFAENRLKLTMYISECVCVWAAEFREDFLQEEILALTAE